MDRNTNILLSTAYLPCIQYYSKLISYRESAIEYYEHYVKQTYRNRSCIYGTNGKLSLTVPLEKRSERTIIKDIRISYTYDWQKIHWRSIESAYRCSPFFEYYEADFFPLFSEKKYYFLIDLNEKSMSVINKLLKINPTLKKTTAYEKSVDGFDDFRSIISPKTDFQQDKNFHNYLNILRLNVLIFQDQFEHLHEANEKNIKILFN